jgi:heavy metal sensor kinase
MFNSVRVRLTVWYVTIFGLLLVGFSVYIYAVSSKDLYKRLDRSLSNSARITAASFAAEVEETRGNAAAGAKESLSEITLPDVWVAIFEGDRLLATDFPEGRRPVLPSEMPSSNSGEGPPVFATLAGAGTEGARQAVLPIRIQGGLYFILVEQPLDDLAGQLASLRRIFYVGLPAALLVAGLGGFVLAKKSLAPVVAMSDQAERISARNLHERLEVKNANDELGHLARLFNDLLSRLDRSFESMRAFMADASHELRTPLSIIRGEADVALSRDRDKAEYTEALAIIQDEAERLSRVVDNMLALARADAGQRPLKVEEFYLNDLVEECYKSAHVLAIQRGLSLTVEPAPDIAFRGDEDLLRRMLINLLDNAIKYTQPGGSVVVRLSEEGSSIKMVVSDTGIGIPAESVVRVFERFYRVNKARSRADGGTGLGLAIAKWAAEAHDGTIEVTSEPERGSTFTVVLPHSGV